MNQDHSQYKPDIDETEESDVPETSGEKKGLLKRLELPRALFHIIMISVWAIDDFAYNNPVIVSLVFALCVAWEILRRIWPNLNDLPLIRYTLRKKEKKGLTPATFFLIGLMLCIKYFERPDIVRTAIWVTAFADPAARIVGITWGRFRILRFKKTFEGSLACMLITCAVVFISLFVFGTIDEITFWIALSSAILAGVLVSAAEAFIPSLVPTLMDDNFWVLVICSVAIYLVRLISELIITASSAALLLPTAFL